LAWPTADLDLGILHSTKLNMADSIFLYTEMKSTA